MCYFKRWKIKRITKKLKYMQLNRLSNQPGDELLKKEIAYYFQLVELYKKLQFKKKFPFAPLLILESYRAASSLDDSQAHYQLGQLVLDEAKFRQKLQEEGVFNSQANSKKCDQLFEEAHAHLLAADNLGHTLAKRLRGLCFINGWGLDPDKNTGFELIVASIDQEGSWDKVPQIFASIGLNKPEFFAAIMQRRKEPSK